MTSRQRYRRAFRAAVGAYKASRVNRKLQDRSEKPGPLQSSSSTGDSLQQEDEKVPAVDAAKRLTAALAGYSEQVRNAERPDPDTELENARQKMGMAMRIVEEGGISHALCRSLLSEVLRWKYGITQTDFQNNLAFDATEINVDVEKVGYLGNEEKTNVEFTFDGRRFRVVHLDKGVSSLDDQSWVRGEVNLHVDDHLKLAMNVSKDYEGNFGFGNWRCWRVTALDPGDWMQVLLRISAKIDSHEQCERSTFDNNVLEAGSRINLPDDLENI